MGFVNGIPLLFVELKATHKNLRNAFDHNLKDYRDTIPHLFWTNAFIILSNGSKSVMGTSSSSWEQFTDWKKINSEGEQGVISLETMVRGTCEPERFLDIVENFVLYEEAQGGLVKLMAVVISQAQNEIANFKEKGLDILPHRTRIVKEQLDVKFKKADDPLRIVFVCAMWITGFDAPTCSTIYLDKPMGNHTLMQTISKQSRQSRAMSGSLCWTTQWRPSSSTTRPSVAMITSF